MSRSAQQHLLEGKPITIEKNDTLHDVFIRAGYEEQVDLYIWQERAKPDKEISDLVLACHRERGIIDNVIIIPAKLVPGSVAYEKTEKSLSPCEPNYAFYAPTF